MTKSSRRRSSAATPGAVVFASHCCGTTRPSGPIASRTTWIQARSSTKPRRASSPVRGHAMAWSPQLSTRARQPGVLSPPHLARVMGRGKRMRRRSARCIRSGVSVVAGSAGMAASHAPACGPAWQQRTVAGPNGSRTCSRKEVRSGGLFYSREGIIKKQGLTGHKPQKQLQCSTAYISLRSWLRLRPWLQMTCPRKRRLQEPRLLLQLLSVGSCLPRRLSKKLKAAASSSRCCNPSRPLSASTAAHRSSGGQP